MMLKSSMLAFGFMAGILGLNGIDLDKVPVGYSVPDNTLSPDHRYGVLVPQVGTAGGKNMIVQLPEVRIIALILAPTGYVSANFNQVLPTRWGANDSLLLWEVDGKWCPTALTLVKPYMQTIAWQIDLLKVGQQAILAGTKKVRPAQYAAEKARNAGNGSDYPDGFTIDVAAEGKAGDPVTLPLVFHVYLTSNPKGLDDPSELNSRLDAKVNENGKIVVTGFHLGNTPPAPRW
jgi:hypothetical protein